MEIVDIFVVVNDSLYSVKYDNENGSAFQSLFNRWQDVEHLEDFFENNVDDLQSGFYGNITVEEAIMRTIDESAKFEEIILNAAKAGKTKDSESLGEVVFTDLHDGNYSHIHIQSKAYGPKHHSWLRVYAIRVSDNLYFVSGGAIKLTEVMQGKEHLELELSKLEATASHLKEIGLIDEGDLGFIEIGKYEED